MADNNLSPLRTLIVASSPLARAGLATMLSDQQEINVVGQISDEALSDALDVYRPEVLVWDVGYEPLNSLDRLTELRGSHAAVLILVADEHSAADALPMLIGAGVRGILSQEITGDGLMTALLSLSHGMMIFSAFIGEAMVSRSAFPSAGEREAVLETFTPREREVLELVAEGLPNKTIARRLSISEHTVKFHLNAILTKLGAQSRTEAVVRATRLGLIAL